METPGIRFQETIVSYVLTLVVALIELGLVSNYVFLEKTGSLLLTPLPIAVLFLYFQMRISVDYNYLKVSYGAGFITKVFLLADIHSYKIIPNTKIWGWLYNPLSKHILIVRFREGNTIILPVNEPKRMIGILNVRV